MQNGMTKLTNNTLATVAEGVFLPVCAYTTKLIFTLHARLVGK
jgi:hypothetical protein